MIARTVVLGAAVGAALVAGERWLAGRSGSGEPPAIESLAVVEAPIEAVWAAVSDIEQQVRWMHEMKSVRLLTPPPVGAGTRAEATIRILGVSVEDPVTVTAWEPPRRFGIRHDGLYKGHGTIELEPGADGTTTIVRWSETLIPPVLPHLTAALQRPVLAAIFQDDLATLRRLVEQRG